MSSTHPTGLPVCPECRMILMWPDDDERKFVCPVCGMVRIGVGAADS